MAKAKPKDPLEPKRCAELLAALAAPERLEIVRFLTAGPKNVTEIIGAVKIPALNVSHHLATLKHAGIIEGEKKGRFVFYALRDGILGDAVAAGIPKETLDLGCCQLLMPGKC